VSFILVHAYISEREPGKLSQYSNRIQAGQLGFDSLQGQEIFFSTATGYRLVSWVSIPCRGKGFFSPQHPGWLWGSTSPLTNHYWRISPGGKAACGPNPCCLLSFQFPKF
jgi:hypothetical protein